MTALLNSVCEEFSNIMFFALFLRQPASVKMIAPSKHTGGACKCHLVAQQFAILIILGKQPVLKKGAKLVTHSPDDYQLHCALLDGGSMCDNVQVQAALAISGPGFAMV